MELLAEHCESSNIHVLVPVEKEDPRFKIKANRTLHALSEAWLESNGYFSPKTVYNYREAIKRFEIFIGHRKVTPNLWREYQMFLINKKHTYWTIRILVRPVKQFFTWCEKRGYVKANPCAEYIRVPRSGKIPKPTFTYDEYERMKQHCKGPTSHEQYCLIVMCYNTGMSPVDVCLLKWDCVDLENQTLKFFRQKMITRQGRQCVIHIETNSDLHRLLLHQRAIPEEEKRRVMDDKTDYVFPTLAIYHNRGRTYALDSHPTGHTELYQMLSCVMKRAGITGKSLKSFRNTFCSDMVNSGVDLITVCQMTGHSNPKQLLEYCKPDMESISKAIATRKHYLLNKKQNAPPN